MTAIIDDTLRSCELLAALKRIRTAIDWAEIEDDVRVSRS